MPIRVRGVAGVRVWVCVVWVWLVVWGWCGVGGAGVWFAVSQCCASRA